jgi:hypothetical protein
MRLLHPQHHAVQCEEGVLECLERLIDVTILLPEQVEWVLGWKLVLQFVD